MSETETPVLVDDTVPADDGAPDVAPETVRPWHGTDNPLEAMYSWAEAKIAALEAKVAELTHRSRQPGPAAPPYVAVAPMTIVNPIPAPQFVAPAAPEAPPPAAPEAPPPAAPEAPPPAAPEAPPPAAA
jgi:hypothetical protein